MQNRRSFGPLGPPRNDRARSRFISMKGMTLIEMMIAAIILGIVSTAALNFYKNQHGQYLQQQDATDVQQNLRATMNELTDRIRLAGYRVFGQSAVVTLNSGPGVAVRFHDGDSIRTQLYFPFQNSKTGRMDLMTQLDGGPMQVFAEGIDSCKFTQGGSGLGTKWIDVELVAKSAREGFQSTQSDRDGGRPEKYIYRRLSSRVHLRNR